MFVYMKDLMMSLTDFFNCNVSDVNEFLSKRNNSR